MMDLGTTAVRAEVGVRMHEMNLVDEMREFRKLRTAFMVEKCRSKNEGLACPKPRKQHIRSTGVQTWLNRSTPDPVTSFGLLSRQKSEEYSALKVGSELSDILTNKASPPYYSGSPPLRTSNPLIEDVHFQQRKSHNSIYVLKV